MKEYIFDGTFILVGEDGSVVTKEGNPILHYIDKQKIWVNNHAHVLSELKEEYSLRYIYYYLSTVNINHLVKGMPPKLNKHSLSNIEILVPPLPIQQQIVATLDSFDSLINSISEGLPREIELRQKQYEYYREKLFTFDE